MPLFTLQQIEDRVYDLLDGNAAFYPEANVRGAINQALRRLNALAGINRATVAVPGFTVAGRLVYDTPTGILVPIKVYFEQEELSMFGLRALAERFRDWATDTNRYQGPVAHWSAIGLSRFLIHPMDYYGGQLLEVEGVAPITALVNPGDVISLEDEHVEIVIDYARTRIMLKEGGVPFEQASLAYQVMIARVKTMLLFDKMTFPRYYVPAQQQQGGA